MSEENLSAISLSNPEQSIANRAQGGVETQSTAISAQLQTQIEAGYKLAWARPRNMDTFRVKLIAACKRPGFWETARYVVPRGNGKVEGFSIRFAEECIRNYGNLDNNNMIVYEDAKMRTVRVNTVDLENNIAFHTDVQIEKTVERKFLKDGQKPISTRIGSDGKAVHLVPATDDDIQIKQNALISKAMRNQVLRLVPGDILAECKAMLVEISTKGVDENDKELLRKKVVDGFARLSVMPDQIEKYLGHPVGQCSPAQLVELRGLYEAIKDGEGTWADALAQKEEERKPKDAKAETKKSEPPKTTADLKAAEKAKAEKFEMIMHAGCDGAGCPDCDMKGEVRK